MIYVSTLEIIAAVAKDLGAGAMALKTAMERAPDGNCDSGQIFSQMIAQLHRSKEIMDAAMAHFDEGITQCIPDWLKDQLSQALTAADTMPTNNDQSAVRTPQDFSIDVALLSQ